MAMLNTQESKEGFARAPFSHALQRGWPLYFSTDLTAYNGPPISSTSSGASTRPHRETVRRRAAEPALFRQPIRPEFAFFCKNRGNRRRERAKTDLAPLTRQPDKPSMPMRTRTDAA